MTPDDESLDLWTAEQFTRVARAGARPTPGATAQAMERLLADIADGQRGTTPSSSQLPGLRGGTLPRGRMAGAVRHRFRIPIAATGALLCAWIVGRLVTPAASSHSSSVHATASNERRTVRLPDGSRALLGPDTRVVVNANDDHVRVRVIGAAWFTVTPRSTGSFVVDAGQTSMRVLGTTFAVQYSPANGLTRVLVTNGRVATRGAARMTSSAASAPHYAVLSARMLGVIGDSGDVRVTPNVTIGDRDGWLSGQLVFREVPMTEIAGALSRAYATDIRIPDPALGRSPVTITVSVSAHTVDEVLVAIARTFDARVVRRGRVLTIMASPPPRDSRAPHSPSTSESHYGR